MAQEIAAEMTAPPTGGIWRAWWEAFWHPKYATFARWYPRMQTRWRLISLAVSLALIVITSFVLAGFFIAPSNDAQQPFTFMRYLSYLTSPGGTYQILAYVMASVAILFALPPAFRSIPIARLGHTECVSTLHSVPGCRCSL